MTDPVSYQLEDDVAVLRFDDGKANALGHAAIAGFHQALDRAETEARAAVIVGRPDRFCAGFDLDVMRGGTADMQALVKAGAVLCVRLYTAQIPVVAACTGHALAAGAILLLSSDTRIGAEGDYRIGLPEVAIGMPLPVFGTELARDRLSRRHFQAATLQAKVYSPAEAVDAGFLDSTAPLGAVEAEARAHAAGLAASLSRTAFRQTRQNVRAATAQLISETLDADVASFGIDADA